MKLGSLSSARPSIYDRNASGSLLGYTGNSIAPHALTTRFTQTIASGKKAVVESAFTQIWRDSAPGASGPFWGLVQLTSGATTVNMVGVLTATTTLYQGLAQTQAGQVTLYAGETIAGVTSDTSTGGTTAYWISAKLTVFDG